MSAVSSTNAAGQDPAAEPTGGGPRALRQVIDTRPLFRTVRAVTTNQAEQSLTADLGKGRRRKRRQAIDAPPVLRTVRAVTTNNQAEPSPTATPTTEGRRQANRHLDRLLSPGKDPSDPTGCSWLPPVQVPAGVRAGVLELADAYRHHQLVRPDVANRVRKGSADAEALKITQFLLYAAVREPGRAPSSYDAELIHRYRGELAGIGASVATLNTAHKALRKFFDLILAPGVPNPARVILLAKTSVSGARLVYPVRQADAMLAAAAAGTTGVRPRSGRPLMKYQSAWADYVVVALWFYLGADAGELLGALVGDADLTGCAIKWRGGDGQPTHTQPMPARLVTILSSYLAAARPGAGPGEALVTNPRADAGRGGVFSDQGLCELARRVAVAAGVGAGNGRGQGHSPRRWRDTYVARVVRTQHGSLLAVKVLLGLQHFASTQVYGSLAVATKSVTVQDAHAGWVAPAGLDTARWPLAQLSLAATQAAPTMMNAAATTATTPAVVAGDGAGPRRRARAQVRSLAGTGINPADPATLLDCEQSLPGHLGGAGLGRKTQTAYQLEAVYLRAWLAASAPQVAHPRDATGEQLLAYLDYLAVGGSSVATRRRTTSALRAYYAYLAIQHPGLVNPTDVLPSLAEVVAEADFHTQDDVAAVLACAWQAATDAYLGGDVTGWLLARRDHAILAVLAFAATRRREARALACLEVDPDARLLTLHGKGKTSRTIEIPQVLAQILAAYLRDVRPHFPAGEFLFTDLAPAGADTDDFGRAWPRLGKEVIYRICCQYGTLAGVAGPVNPHAYRHSGASRLHAAGMSISDISAFLGHASKLITLRYIHIDQGFLDTVLAEAFPPAATEVSHLTGTGAGAERQSAIS